MLTNQKSMSVKQALDAQMQDQTVVQILDQALDMYGDDLAIAFSGAEDVALIQYASMTGKKFRVFSLDTGRLNPETYQLFDDVEKHFGIKIEFTFPDEKAVTDLVNEKGMFSFFEDGHKECCGVRKVQPLRRKLKTLKAWVTGQRKDQSPGTRMAVPASLPLSSGSTRPIAVAAPVEVGIMDNAAARARRLSECGSQAWRRCGSALRWRASSRHQGDRSPCSMA